MARSLTQYEAVVLTLERLGGIATLGKLYEEVFKVPCTVWNTRTPQASIRRIVQLNPDIYKLKPGLYGLVRLRSQLEAKGYIVETPKNRNSAELQKFNHTYYQAVLLKLGSLKGHACWSPNQDKNRQFLGTSLGELRTLDKIPPFAYDNIVKRSESIDVIWFNERRMPTGLFEVEHTTDMQNSLIKFSDLQDYNSRMFIVAAANRQREFTQKINYTPFQGISKRVKFLSYEWLDTEFRHATAAAVQETRL